MKTKIFLTFLILSLTSCLFEDPPFDAQISNQTDSNAIIEISFDSTILKKHYTRHEYRIMLTKEYGYSVIGHDSVTKLISFDTINLIQKYSIPHNSTYNIRGWGERNLEVPYNKIKIMTKNNTIELKDLDAIKEKFKRVNYGTNRFEIYD
jgi:hypothetical protein